MFSKFKKKKKSKLLTNNASLIERLTDTPVDSLIIEFNSRGEILKVKGDIKAAPFWHYESLVGKTYVDLLHIDDLERFENLFKSVLNGNIEIAENFNLIYEEIIQINFSLFPITSNEEVIEGIYCILKQVVHHEQIPMISINHLHKIPSNSRDIMGVINKDGLIIYESYSTLHLLGYELEDFSNQEFSNFMHIDNKVYFDQMLKDITRNSDIPITTELLLKNKSGIWIEYEVIFTNLIHNENVNGILYTCRDITEQKKSQSKILYLSNHDEFTGLPNRKAFEERVNLEIKLATAFDKNFAVLFLKIEGFEFLDRMIDPRIGDKFIKKTISQLKNIFSENIEFVAKVSDNGFFILTKHLEESSSIINFSENVLSHLNKPISFQEYKIRLSPKMGISVFPLMGKEATELIMNSRSSLYLVGNSSTEDYRITSSINLEAMSRLLALKKDLKHAVTRNQLIMFYQPIYHAKTTLIESVEALIRWEHPTYGLVYPDEFIYLAEQYELMDLIGGWVLKTVFRDLARWHHKGLFVRGALNVSPKQLANSNFIDMIHQMIVETAIKPHWIDIEITENYKLEDPMSLQQINELKELGFNISLDDFGTGYNSLKNLQLIKPNKIKLDRLFTKELITSTISESIISSIMQLAKDLSMIVIAEGVETEEQRSFLLKHGCDYLQGYLFSRPVTTSNIEKLLERQWLQEKEGVKNGKENRAYFRLDFSFPLEAQMTISELNGRKIEVSKTNVLIKNIGAGGLLFVSDIPLPTNGDFVVQIEINLLQEPHLFYGTIVHHKTIVSLHYFGIKFKMTEIERNKYISLFNQMQLMLNKSAILLDHSFVLEKMQTYFQKKSNTERV